MRKDLMEQMREVSGRVGVDDFVFTITPTATEIQLRWSATMKGEAYGTRVDIPPDATEDVAERSARQLLVHAGRTADLVLANVS